MNRFCDKIIRASFETKHFAFFAPMTRQHNGGDLRNCRRWISAQQMPKARCRPVPLSPICAPVTSGGP